MAKYHNKPNAKQLKNFIKKYKPKEPQPRFVEIRNLLNKVWE